MFVNLKKYVIYSCDKNIKYIPPDTEMLCYNSDDKITFEIPKLVKVLLLSHHYNHNINFIQNTSIDTIIINKNKYDNIITNLPDNITLLIIAELVKPITNINCCVQKIIIYNEPQKNILEKSKIPFGCEIYVGCGKNLKQVNL